MECKQHRRKNHSAATCTRHYRGIYSLAPPVARKAVPSNRISQLHPMHLAERNLCKTNPTPASPCIHTRSADTSYHAHASASHEPAPPARHPMLFSTVHHTHLTSHDVRNPRWRKRPATQNGMQTTQEKKPFCGNLHEALSRYLFSRAPRGAQGGSVQSNFPTTPYAFGRTEPM